MLAIQLIYFNFFFCGRKHNLIAALSNSLFYCLLIKKKVAQIHQDLPVDPCYLLSTIIFVVSAPSQLLGPESRNAPHPHCVIPARAAAKKTTCIY